MLRSTLFDRPWRALSAYRMPMALSAAACCSVALGLACIGLAHAVTAPALKTARAASAPPAMIDALRNNTGAFRAYMLNCGGCHRADGKGVPRNGVPSFVGSAGMFTWTPDGRQYLIRVPGSASSHLDDKELAAVLNWIVATYSPQQLPPYFKPFTAGEVAAVRYHHYKNVAAARHAMDMELARLGMTPSLYLYGVNQWNTGEHRRTGSQTGSESR